jgi:uncharacterized protein YecE (DUF72 family)
MFYAGTSGYSFKEWVGPFYPEKTPVHRFLSFYASRLKTVEINYTFRHFPTEKLLASWAAQTPETFKFSFKMHQSVTHIFRLKEVDSRVRDFLQILEALGPRLGVVLFQLPPSLHADPERLKNVLDELPGDKKFAFEFRHRSWEKPETSALLRGAGAALCAAEVEMNKEIPPLTASHAYIRVREVPPFSKKDMAVMREKIRRILEQVDDLYFYIKHDPAGVSPRIALQLQEEFGK